MVLFALAMALTIPHIGTPPPIDGNLSNAAWKRGAVARLSYNLRTHGPATDATTDYIETDGVYLYVGIDARQREPVQATQHTNGVGLDTDDEVQIDLWPNGANGFRYKFISTPNGTHYQNSTENANYEPTWWSAGRIDAQGFTVTMKIPLDVLHGAGASRWRIQLARLVMSTGDDFVWSYGPDQQNHNDVSYAAAVSGLPNLNAFRQKPRIGLYTLGAIASTSAGGPTSRAGADISVPIAAGTSFVATVHPDFSNVDLDQQSISPTAFARSYTEVRPFFTQGAGAFNRFSCWGCPGITALYTPSIPTPREGYAIEGQRGAFSFAGFDAVGAARDDTAQAVSYTSPNQHDFVGLQHSSASATGGHDTMNIVGYWHDNRKHVFYYANYGSDRNSAVAGDGRYYEAGASYYGTTGGVNFELRKLGEGFDPVDGYVAHPGIAGYDINANKQIKYPARSSVSEIDFDGELNRYHGANGRLNQTENWIRAAVTSRNSTYKLYAKTGSWYLQLADGSFSPVTQSGVELDWRPYSSTPAWMAFLSGRFGPGRLTTTYRNATMRVGIRGLLTIEADDTVQYIDRGSRNVQWLERASFTYLSGPDASLALGVRRIVGTPPMLATLPAFQSAWNLSAGYHRKVAGGELYVVYGDAAAFSTTPQFVIKLVRYVGAEKGT
jgi:hypothetical protein